MDAKLFEVLGKYAGLGGFSIGLVLLLFREILKKNIFPMLHNEQAYLLIRQLMYLTFGIGALGILSWAFVNQGGSAGGAITGHITDRDTKTAVANAEITLSGRPEMARTDGAGNFTLTITNSPPPCLREHTWARIMGISDK